MSELPVVSGKKLLRLFLKNGFVALRKKGSHVFIQSTLDKERGTAVPVHGNEDLGKGLLKSILSDLDLSVEDLLEMRKK